MKFEKLPETNNAIRQESQVLATGCISRLFEKKSLVSTDKIFITVHPVFMETRQKLFVLPIF